MKIQEFDIICGECLWGCNGNSIDGHSDECNWHAVAALKAERDDWKRRAEIAAHIKEDDKAGFDWAVLEWEAERDALKAEVQRLKDEYNEEVDELNSGFDAFNRGEPIENEFMHPHSHDVWTMGWVWAQHQKVGKK